MKLEARPGARGRTSEEQGTDKPIAGAEVPIDPYGLSQASGRSRTRIGRYSTYARRQRVLQRDCQRNTRPSGVSWSVGVLIPVQAERFRFIRLKRMLA